MKYIKKFEIIKSEAKPNYKIGDTVICIYDKSNLVKYGKKYIVEDLNFKDGRYFVKIKNLTTFYARNFLSEFDFELKKYNL